MVQMCAPAFIYLFISLFDIIYNAYLGLYNNLLVKTIVIISVAIVLNILCKKGFSEISWLIVLLSFSFIGMIVVTKMGCNMYNMPTMNTPSISMPDVISFNNSYKNVPVGTSDPQYQS
jgi:hypothetical protein